MQYRPHEYQSFATEFILSHPVAAILLSMGLGKSVITLTALFDLCLDRFEIGKALIIAPLRVASEIVAIRNPKMGPPAGTDVQRGSRNGSRTEIGAAKARQPAHHQPGKRALAGRSRVDSRLTTT